MAGTKDKAEAGSTLGAGRAAAREKRLAEALRANLKRRKGSAAERDDAHAEACPAGEPGRNQGER